MAGLNPSQQKAVSTLSGPLLVLAGAGTGKTRVVTYRIANLIKNGIKPERILGVTFTNKAAQEMKERIEGLLGKRRATQRPEISTFHSLCVKILRRQITHLGYPANYSILDRGEQESIAKSVLREIRVSDAQIKPSELLWRISSWKSKSIRPSKAATTAETDKEHFCAMAYRRYQRHIKDRGAVDFDDLLLLTEELFGEHDEIRDEEASRFDHILIDEYQDTNQSQYQIVKALARGHRNLCVVGDDDQSIYAWRGAEVQHILSFDKDWPDAEVVRLQDNYRSTGSILKLANTLIEFNKLRFDKVLKAARPGGMEPPIHQFPNETKEAEETVRSIRNRLSQPGVEPRDIAILFRTNEQPRAFEVELRKAKIPYVLLGGQSFFDRKEVRDIMAYLKIVVNPDDDVSLLRVLNTPRRGVGSKVIDALVADGNKTRRSVWKSMKDCEQIPGVSSKAQDVLHRFVSMIERFQQKQDQDLAEVARQMIAEVNYRAELQRLYTTEEEQELKMQSVEEVVNALASYCQQKQSPSLGEFLQDAAIEDRDFDNDKEKKLQRNSVALLTLHSAKGLEYPEVYMVGMEEGILPHRRSVEDEIGESIDEERRLCYVGITRAQERLTLSLSLTRMKWGKPRESNPSRFLFEMIGKADNPNAYSKRKQGKSKNSTRAVRDH